MTRSAELECTLSDSQWTVGEIKTLTCTSSYSINLTLPIEVSFTTSAYNYALKVLNVKQISPYKIELQVTGYKTGSYFKTSFILSDVQNNYQVKPLSWEIVSVAKNSEQLKLHPPHGPWQADWPIWYSAVWGILLCFMVVLSAFQVNKYFSKRRVLKKVRFKLGKQTPLQYFIQQMGVFLKIKEAQKNEFVDHLFGMLYDYLENQCLISSSKLKTKKDFYTQINLIDLSKERRSKLGNIYEELVRASQDSKKYSKKDLNQLLHMVRDWVFDYASYRGSV